MEVSKIFDDEFFLQRGEIFLTGEIDDQTYLKISRELRYILSLDVNPVKLYLNSPGGSLEDALAIIDDFQLAERYGKQIWTIATGTCCSAAAIILAYGHKRYSTPGASHMLHPMSYDMGEAEHQSTKSYVDYAEKLYNDVTVDLAIRCGRKSQKSIAKFFREIRDGLWLNTEAAIEFKLVDGIWDYSLEK